MKYLKRYLKVSIAIGHGIFLFIGVWLINNSSYTNATDEGTLKQINMLKKNLFNNKQNYEKDFVFINVSRDIKLINDPVEYGEMGITDRNKLADFFKILADNNNQHYYTLCDIFLEYSTDADSGLLKQIERCEKLLFPFHINADSIQKPVLDVNTALSDYVTYTGNFSKFKLVYKDSIKTTPLVLLEKLDKKEYPSSFLDFKSIFPRYYITYSQLLTTKEYPYYNLGELLMLSPIDSFYDNFLKNKFIIIGNFDTDVHFSPVGKIPGSLILLNTYLTLKNEGSVSWWWALFMIAGLSYISYILFFGKIKAPDIRNLPWLDFIMKIFINKYFSFTGTCLLLVILSSFIFSVQLNISLLLLYLLTVHFFQDFYKRHYKRQK
jgi:hypothetical protein